MSPNSVNASDLQSLAQRCEASSAPDRYLDRSIELAIFPDRVNPAPGVALLEYTASLDAAMTLVPDATRWPWNVTMATAYRSVSVIPNHGGSYGISDPYAGHSRGAAANVPLALSAAALRARAAIAIDTRQGGDAKQAPSRSDESAAIAQDPGQDTTPVDAKKKG